MKRDNRTTESESLSQRRFLHDSSGIWIKAADLVGLPGQPTCVQSVNRRGAKDRRLKRRRRAARGGGWEYRLDTLPQETQVHLALASRTGGTSLSKNTTGLGMEPAATIREKGEAETRKAQAEVLSDQDVEAILSRFEQQPSGLQKRAHERLQIVDAYFRLAGVSMPEMKRKDEICERFCISQPTLRRLLDRVEGKDRRVWVAHLVPSYKGCQRRVECTPDAWDKILDLWGSQSKPPLKQVMREVREQAGRENWTIPSDRTVAARIEALPVWRKVLLREGQEALARMYPPVRRDYSVLRVHELWCSDGHKADVMCRWPDGIVGRPIVVAWMDVRTRYVLGWKVGRTENTDIICVFH